MAFNDRMCRFKIILLSLFVLLFSQSCGQPLQNPVLKGVADAGVLRFGGKYYIGGVHTYGDFFVSTDLVHWKQRIHVFDLDNQWTHGTGAKNNQIHANDMIYHNGQFHLLFSVNYWGNDRHIVHITHAVSPKVDGKYVEVRPDQWTENRIDPMVFKDEDGKLYLYMVKFTEGNAIWVRPMHADFSFSGDAMLQFSSQPDTWETYDNRVAEGPFVIKYRGRYYMMYNANHTAPEYGNYRLGVCEASSPMCFNAGGKYPYPVLGPPTDRPLSMQAEQPVTDTLFTPGQPNLVRGPNGWEWWLVYMANQGMQRDQYIDRVHFVNNKLSVDGITGKKTPGFHPQPAQPMYAGKSLDSLRTTDAFLLELTFSSKRSQQGVSIGQQQLMLPHGFSTGVPHEWRIEKNNGLLAVWIDGVLVYDHVTTGIRVDSPIRWLGNASEYQVVYVTYTEGWDEYDHHFSGWERCRTLPQGIQLTGTSSLKGNAASSYAFSVMFSQPAALTPSRYGLYAYYINARNYLKVGIDTEALTFTTELCQDGKVQRSAKPLSHYDVHYPDVKYSDSFEKQYRFDAITQVSGILCPRESGESAIATQQVSYLDGDTWHPLAIKIKPSAYPGVDEATFNPVSTHAIRLINRNPVDHQRHVYRMETRRDVAAQYQLRVDRRGDTVVVYVDRNEVARYQINQLPPARVGLFNDGQARVNVMNTFYYRIK